MKKLLQIALLALTITLCFTSCSSDDDDNGDDFVTEYSSLPTLAKDFVNTHYRSQTVTSALERYLSDPTTGLFYKVYLTGGYEIDFNKGGQWIRLKSDLSGFSSSLFETEIPIAIKNYVEKEYPNQRMVEVLKTSNGFNINLSNNTKLFFDKAGKFSNIM